MSTERIRELEQQVADLRAQVEALTSERAMPVRERSSRREVLRRGVLLAGTGAAVAAVARPGTAAAADGDALIAGADTTSTGSTGVLSTISDGTAFYAESSGGGVATGVTGVSTSSEGTGVFGLASATSGATSGVNGESASSNGVGVFGLNTAGGVGVEGYASAPSGGVGVVGSSGAQNGTGVEGSVGSSGPGVGVGVSGVTAQDNGTGVRGFVSGAQGVGVEGVADAPSGATTGVFGRTRSSDGVGVLGLHASTSAGSGAALVGRSTTPGGTAVVAEATDGVGVRASGTAAAIRLVSSGPAPATTTQFRQGGELYVDDAGDLWFCRVHGSPGTWVRLTSSSVPTSSASLAPIVPYRAFDSRAAGSGGPLLAGQRSRPSVAVKIDLNTGLSSPLPPLSGLVGVTYNVTITNTVGAGWLAVVPGDATSAEVSTINWSASGVTMANASFSGVDSEQRLSVFVGGAPGAATDYIIDITGYLR